MTDQCGCTPTVLIHDDPPPRRPAANEPGQLQRRIRACELRDRLWSAFARMDRDAESKAVLAAATVRPPLLHLVAAGLPPSWTPGPHSDSAEGPETLRTPPVGSEGQERESATAQFDRDVEAAFLWGRAHHSKERRR